MFRHSGSRPFVLPIPSCYSKDTPAVELNEASLSDAHNVVAIISFASILGEDTEHGVCAHQTELPVGFLTRYRPP